MKHSILTSIGLGVSIVALAVPSAQAAPTLPTENDPRYPASEGYRFVDGDLTVPAGFLCSGEINLRFVGHERNFVNGKVVDDSETPPEFEKGDRLKAQSPDEILILTNTKTGRTITKPITGTFYDRVVDFGEKGALDLRGTGVGKNVYFGPGVEGILFASGRQRYTVTNFLDNGGVLHVNKAKGKTVELCHKVGLQAVPGKVPPAPESSPETVARR